jgi:hypothetical protein
MGKRGMAPHLIDRIVSLASLSAVNGVVWGIWFIAFPAAFTNSITFSGLAAVAPRYTWGVVMILLGAMGLYGLIFARADVIASALLLLFGIWMFIALEFFSANPASTALPAALIRAIYTLLTLLRDYTNGHIFKSTA